MPSDVFEELEALLDELEGLLKSPGAGATLGERGVNASLALVVAQGLRAYVQGNKKQAADDLATAGEEIGARLALSDEARSAGRKDPDA